MDVKDALERTGPQELVSLNLLDLDVEELETRLEMAAAVPNSDCWANYQCGINVG
jgi:hypothetical protein